jgi:hypothetical protein
MRGEGGGVRRSGSGRAAAAAAKANGQQQRPVYEPQYPPAGMMSSTSSAHSYEVSKSPQPSQAHTYLPTAQPLPLRRPSRAASRLSVMYRSRHTFDVLSISHAHPSHRGAISSSSGDLAEVETRQSKNSAISRPQSATTISCSLSKTAVCPPNTRCRRRTRAWREARCPRSSCRRWGLQRCDQYHHHSSPASPHPPPRAITACQRATRPLAQ